MTVRVADARLRSRRLAGYERKVQDPASRRERNLASATRILHILLVRNSICDCVLGLSKLAAFKTYNCTLLILSFYHFLTIVLSSFYHFISFVSRSIILHL